MVLQVNQPTEEQTQQDNSKQAELHKSVLDTLKSNPIQNDILKDLGLSPVTKKEVKKEEPQEEIAEEQEEIEEVEEVEEVEETDEEEEVVPKSKIQPRIDKLTATIKSLQDELEQLKTTKAEPKDGINSQLENMSAEQLRTAKMEVRKAQLKAQDDTKLSELLDLEDKIDTALRDAPTRFKTNQESALRKEAEKIAQAGDIPNLDKAGPEIWKKAEEIYKQYPLLQKDVNGQATALRMAADLYKVTSNSTGDKSKETELKRQVNNLKRKTTLDTKSTKGDVDKDKLEKMKKDAIGGTYQQKVNLIKSHPAFNVNAMIPEEFKGN